jgi:hypothetical protein
MFSPTFHVEFSLPRIYLCVTFLFSRRRNGDATPDAPQFQLLNCHSRGGGNPNI